MRESLKKGALELRRLIEEASGGIVITHRNADIDALASAIIAHRIMETLGASGCIAFPEGISRAAREALHYFGVDLSRDIACRELEATGHTGPELAIAVDATNLAQLNPLAGLYLEARTKVVIDHHEPGSLAESADLSLAYPNAASTTELTVVLGQHLGVRLDESTASLAAAGVLSDSRRFLIAAETTFEAMSILMGYGCKYESALEFLRQTGTRVSEDLSLRVAKLKAFSRIKLGKSCKELLIAVTHIGSHESGVARSLVAEGADVAVVVVERAKEFRVAVRVSSRALSMGVKASMIASFIAEKFGGEGGGHETAGMAHLPADHTIDSEGLAQLLSEKLPGKIGRWCSEPSDRPQNL